jgi:hypothetical protein
MEYFSIDMVKERRKKKLKTSFVLLNIIILYEYLLFLF